MAPAPGRGRDTLQRIRHQADHKKIQTRPAPSQDVVRRRGAKIRGSVASEPRRGSEYNMALTQGSPSTKLGATLGFDSERRWRSPTSPTKKQPRTGVPARG